MLLVALALIVVLFWPAFGFAAHKWDTDPNYGHGFFVPIAAGYLVWRRRAAIRSQVPRGSVAGLAFVIPAVLLHIMAQNAGLNRFSLVAFDAALAGTVVVFFGWGMLRQVAFPLAFLLSAVPIPLYLESATLPMKLMASTIAVYILRALGMTIYLEGVIIHLSNTTLEVATACSGLRSLVLVCTVGAFYAYTSQQSLPRRLAVFCASIPIALGANVIRIIATAALSNVADTETLRKFIHDFSGVFVFIIAGALFVGIGLIVDRIADSRLFRKPDAALAQGEAS